MTERSFDEMIAYVNRRVAGMDISQGCKIELLGMVTALGYKHEKSAQRWIPCSERLPEIGVNVLTVWTYEEYEPDIVVAHLKEWNGELYFDDVFGEYDHALKDVPAWMPLPEPWRGEET